MTHAERSDARLVELSRQGLASAFGVLVHRHGPTVLDLAGDDEDPIGATVATFLRAMCTLPDADPDDVRGWLMGLAAIELGHDPDEMITAAATTTSPGPVHRDHGPSTLTTLPSTQTLDPRLDEVWSELAPRWPAGRRPRHLPSWAIWVGTTIVLLALAVLLPWAVLGSLGSDQPLAQELRASPVLEDIEVEDEPIVEEDAEPLPTFDFPQPPDDDSSTTQAPVEPEPTTEPEPSGEPEPAPTPPAEGPTPTDDAEVPDDGVDGDDSGDADDGTDGGTDTGDDPASDEQDPPAADQDDADPADPVDADPPTADPTTDAVADGTNT